MQSRTKNVIHVCPSFLAGLTDNTSSFAMKYSSLVEQIVIIFTQKAFLK